MSERRIHQNSVVYLIVRNDNANKVIYRLHCSKDYSFEMTAEEWGALPTPH